MAGAGEDREGGVERGRGRRAGVRVLRTRPKLVDRSRWVGAGEEAELDLAEAGLERGGAAADSPDPDLAVGGAGGDVAACAADREVAVAGGEVQVAW